MVTSEPSSGSVGKSPTPVDTVPELGGGEDPPRSPSVATTEATDSAPPNARRTRFTVEVGPPHGYEGGGSGRSHPENADPDQ